MTSSIGIDVLCTCDYDKSILSDRDEPCECKPEESIEGDGTCTCVPGVTQLLCGCVPGLQQPCVCPPEEQQCSCGAETKPRCECVPETTPHPCSCVPGVKKPKCDCEVKQQPCSCGADGITQPTCECDSGGTQHPCSCVSGVTKPKCECLPEQPCSCVAGKIQPICKCVPEKLRSGISGAKQQPCACGHSPKKKPQSKPQSQEKAKPRPQRCSCVPGDTKLECVCGSGYGAKQQACACVRQSKKHPCSCYPGVTKEVCPCFPGASTQPCSCFPGVTKETCPCYPGATALPCSCYPGVTKQPCPCYPGATTQPCSCVPGIIQQPCVCASGAPLQPCVCSSSSSSSSSADSGTIYCDPTSIVSKKAEDLKIKYVFNTPELLEYQRVFRDHRDDETGLVHSSELGDILQELNHKISIAQTKNIIRQLDDDGLQYMTYVEFLEIMSERRRQRLDIETYEFSDSEVEEMMQTFMMFDEGGFDKLRRGDIANLMMSLHQKLLKSELKLMMQEVITLGKKCGIDFEDFLGMMRMICSNADTEEDIRDAFKISYHAVGANGTKNVTILVQARRVSIYPELYISDVQPDLSILQHFEDGKEQDFISLEALRKLLTENGNKMTDEEVDAIMVKQRCDKCKCKKGTVPIELFVRQICDTKLGSNCTCPKSVKTEPKEKRVTYRSTATCT